MFILLCKSSGLNIRIESTSSNWKYKPKTYRERIEYCAKRDNTSPHYPLLKFTINILTCDNFYTYGHIDVQSINQTAIEDRNVFLIATIYVIGVIVYKYFGL